MIASTISTDKRSVFDRREVTLATFYHAAVDARRKTIRRATQSRDIFLDRYCPLLTLISILTLLLSALDSILTLELLRLGAHEINPLMAYLIESDITLFSSVKIAFTAIGLTLLVMLQNFYFKNWFCAKHLLYGFFIIYVILIYYEFDLIQTV